MNNFLKKYRLYEVLQVYSICLFGLLISAKPVSPLTFLTWSAAIFLQIGSCFWLNDYYDAKADSFNPRKIQYQHAPNIPLHLGVTALLLSIILAYFVSSLHLTLVIIGNLISLAYSGRTINLKSKIFFPLIVHFLMGILYFSYGYLLTSQHFSKLAVPMALFYGLVMGTGSLGNELVDRDSDLKMNVRTIANSLNPKVSTTLIISMQFTALLLLAYSSYIVSLPASSFITLAAAVAYLAFCQLTPITQFPQRFRSFYRIVFSICLSFYLINFLKNILL